MINLDTLCYFTVEYNSSKCFSTIDNHREIGFDKVVEKKVLRRVSW